MFQYCWVEISGAFVWWAWWSAKNHPICVLVHLAPMFLLSWCYVYKLWALCRGSSSQKLQNLQSLLSIFGRVVTQGCLGWRALLLLHSTSFGLDTHARLGRQLKLTTGKKWKWYQKSWFPCHCRCKVTSNSFASDVGCFFMCSIFCMLFSWPDPWPHLAIRAEPAIKSSPGVGGFDRHHP